MKCISQKLLKITLFRIDFMNSCQIMLFFDDVNESDNYFFKAGKFRA